MIPQDNYTIRALSLEYLPIKVDAEKDGSSYNPTSDTVQIALPVINTDPTNDDWQNASWQTIDDEYFARVLVGPGGDFELDKGDYDILIKITDSPEIPVLRAGMLTII